MAPSSVLHPKSPAAEDTSAFGPIAERFRRAGDLERAVSLCRDGLQKFPLHISARVTLGWALLDLSKYDEARTELEQVLRRAPDNLAAIRGLAELHDRSEHTLHLPMDGPGQWPPDAVAVEKAAATTRVDPVVFTSHAADPADEPVVLIAGDADEFGPDFLQVDPSVTSAELGAVVWSSAPPADLVRPVVHAAVPLVAESAAPPLAAESTPPPEDEPAEMLVAEPAAGPAAAVEPLVLLAPETDLDPIAELEIEETPVVSEADIAALIAEADSLEAAAETGAIEAEVVAEGVTLTSQSAAHAHIAEVVSLARGAESNTVRSPVAALERFLARVQARRQQLMTESVA